MSDDLEHAELISQLRQLQPAAATMDPRESFYRAGFAAANSQQQPKRSAVPLLAASLLVAVVGIPAGFHAGRIAADNRDVVVEVQIIEQEASPLQAERIMVANEDSKLEPDWFGRWFDSRNGLADSAKRNWEAETMLSAFHSSLVSRDGEEFDRNGLFLGSISSVSIGSDQDSMVVAKPLVASDFQNLSYSLEAAR